MVVDYNIIDEKDKEIKILKNKVLFMGNRIFQLHSDLGATRKIYGADKMDSINKDIRYIRKIIIILILIMSSKTLISIFTSYYQSGT